MTKPFDDLIHGYLDACLSQDDFEDLENRIKANPENARQFIEMIQLHDRLHSEFLGMEKGFVRLADSGSRRSYLPRLSQRMVALSTAACMILFFSITGWFFSGSSTYAASSELQRIIKAGHDSKDRTYLLTTPDSKLKTRPRSTIASEKQPSVDGALLYVRGSDQYVFIRHDAGGSEFITGCDGKLAWSVPPRGRVRLSNDMNRFRGAVPGQQHDIPFIDIRENLNQLLNSYELSISDEDLNSEWRQIIAVRKTSVSGGPKEVTIRYHATSGLIQTMKFERLPQARGGPRSILMDLISTEDLGPDFFNHNSHHDNTREVIEE